MLNPKGFTASLILAVFGLQILFPSAMAQEFSVGSRKRVAIVGFQHGLHLEPEQNTYNTVRQTLQGMDEFQVLDTSSVRLSVSQNMGRKSNQSSSKKMQEAYENFVQGVEFYRNLDLTQAIREFNRAVKGYRESIASLEDNHYLLYSHLYLGMALFFDGRVAEGEKFIREMVLLDSKRKTRTLPARDFPPRIVELHKKQTESVTKISNGVLRVDSNPTGARVLLDGMDVGETPLTIHDVPQGQHFLAIDQAGHEYYKQLVDVKPGEQNIIANLVAQKMFLSKNQFEQNQDEDQKRLLKAMARELSVDYFILGQVEPLQDESFELKLQSYDVMKDQYSSEFVKALGKNKKRIPTHTERLTKDWVDAVAKAPSGSAMAGAVDFQRDFKEPQRPKQIKEKSGSKKLLWIGLGVLAVGAGGYFLFAGDGGADSNVLNIPNPL